MSIKDKITAFLFGSRARDEAVPEAEAAPRVQAEPGPAAAAASSFGAMVVEMPPEHPIHQLYDLRRKEAGPLPHIRLTLDGEGTLPEELLHKESGRCAARG